METAAMAPETRDLAPVAAAAAVVAAAAGALEVWVVTMALTFQEVEAVPNGVSEQISAPDVMALAAGEAAAEQASVYQLTAKEEVLAHPVILKYFEAAM